MLGWTTRQCLCLGGFNSFAGSCKEDTRHSLTLVSTSSPSSPPTATIKAFITSTINITLLPLCLPVSVKYIFAFATHCLDVSFCWTFIFILRVFPHMICLCCPDMIPSTSCVLVGQDLSIFKQHVRHSFCPCFLFVWCPQMVSGSIQRLPNFMNQLETRLGSFHER